ncbi:hypothetical protein 13AC503A_gene0026 [Aeromonas phage 13AC503A]|nr:hypothetical protein 13AC503A_gene0026 [Aeromonas phage 13AC503A]
MSDNVKMGVSVDDIIRTILDPRLGRQSWKEGIKVFCAITHPSKTARIVFEAVGPDVSLPRNHKVEKACAASSSQAPLAEYLATALWEMILSNHVAAAPEPRAWEIGYLHPVREPATNGRLIIKLADMPGARKRWAVWSAEDGVGYMWTEGKTFTPAGDKKAKAIKMQYLRSMHMDDEGIAQLLDDEKLEAAWQG